MAASSEASLDFKVVARYIAAAASAAASTAILLMPFRETSLPSVDISTVGQQPSSDFRTPEDNLRLWQFLTVSWMAPLISTGRNRQLNEDDVWLLGFDFQHSRLHEKFRRLRGSVLGRLLRANGIDVFIISTISIVQLLCGKYNQMNGLCPSANQIYRFFNAGIATAAVAGYEGPIAAKACGFDICSDFLRLATRRCSGTGSAALVWSKII